MQNSEISLKNHKLGHPKKIKTNPGIHKLGHQKHEI